MLDLGVEPRLARILVESERRGCAAEGALVAALASERDICLEARAFGRPAAPHAAGPSDLLLRAELFEQAARRGFNAAACRALDLEPRAVRAVERARRQLERRLRAGPPAGGGAEAVLRCTLAGFPDRVARRRAPGSARALMVGNTGIVLGEESVVREAELFVAVELEGGDRRARGEARVRLASAVERGWLREAFPASLGRSVETVFDPERERVVERRRLSFEDLVLEEAVSVEVDRAAAGEVLSLAARRDPRRAARVGDTEEALLLRLAFLGRWLPELGVPNDVEAVLADAVASLCQGRRSFAEVRARDLRGAILGGLSYPQRQALEREAPSHLRLPGGRMAEIVYERDKPPAAAARIQEVFGLTATPLLAAGRVALVLQLLAPNRRPVQITDDLASFWRNTYPEVRKQLRGRYPKHAWPEDPAG
jgi:ATP-dependent helicase HrpB